MHEDGKKLLNLMFDPEDTVCLSDSQYAYHSCPLASALSEEVTLVSPKSDIPIKKVSSDKIIFVAINPIKGFRCDLEVYKFKNFMLECDTGSIDSQMGYLKQLGIPYSGVVFSGSKSAHILISLAKPIKDEKAYRTIYQWILNVGTLFDQNCKNPSRSIRCPGAIRPETGKVQELLEFKGPVKLEDLSAWLNSHPEAKPKKREPRVISDKPDLSLLKPWVADRLANNTHPPGGRNASWFALAAEFALTGFDMESSIEILRNFFVEERDFKEKEWLTTIASAFKYIYDRK
jgi:hypothetical protein